jgi:hypothetical protein
VCGTLLARADEVIERSGDPFEPRLIDNPGEVGCRLHGHQRRFKRKPRTSASPPIIPDVSLRRTARRPNRLTRDEARGMTVNFALSELLCGSPPISEARQGRRRDAAMHYLSRRPKAEVHSGVRFSPPASARLLLVIQVPHASDKRNVALLSCPIDGFVLGLEGGEDAAADANGIGLGAR